MIKTDFMTAVKGLQSGRLAEMSFKGEIYDLSTKDDVLYATDQFRDYHEITLDEILTATFYVMDDDDFADSLRRNIRDAFEEINDLVEEEKALREKIEKLREQLAEVITKESE